MLGSIIEYSKAKAYFTEMEIKEMILMIHELDDLDEFFNNA